MINVFYNTTNTVTFYLKPSLTNPVYLFSLVSYTTRERLNFISTELSNESNLLQFSIKEVGTGSANVLIGNISIKDFGRYTIEVYEQISTTNLDETLATKLGSDELMSRKQVIYKNPPIRNAISAPEASCTLSVEVTGEDETTAGANDGTALATPTGEQISGQVSYLWSGPNSFTSTSQSISNLAAGQYDVVVTDLNIGSCIANGSYTVESGSFSFGNALKYDGVNDSVSHANINVGSGDDFTYSIWFNTEDLTARVMASGSASNGITINTATELRIFMTTVYDFTVPIMSINTWYMVTFTRISGTLRCYLNATESTTGGVTAVKTTMFNTIGSFTNPLAGWKGLLDKPGVNIGSGATSAQISDLFDGGNGANFDDVITNPTAHWRFTESGTDSTAVEITGNFDGTLNNFIFIPSPWELH